MVDRELEELARDLDRRCRLRGQFVLGGLELGGIPLATMLSGRRGLPTRGWLASGQGLVGSPGLHPCRIRRAGSQVRQGKPAEHCAQDR